MIETIIECFNLSPLLFVVLVIVVIFALALSVKIYREERGNRPRPNPPIPERIHPPSADDILGTDDNPTPEDKVPDTPLAELVPPNDTQIFGKS